MTAPASTRRAAVRSRRDFLKTSGQAVAASVLAGVAIPRVHAGEDNTIHLALIGCGNRGSGAAANALSVPDGGPIKLSVMADLFDDRLNASLKNLGKQFDDKVDVPAERQFLGFDSYKKAIDCLKPGDIAMLTGYAAWRPLQLEYAVGKGVHAFMEKSFACDVPGVHRIIKAGEEAEKKNLKIAAGLMFRHSPARQALIKRIRDGELGQLQLIRGYRMHPVGFMRPKPEDVRELDWQIRNFVRFLWVSGGLYAEMNIHQIDEICWLKGALPVSAHGIGGRGAANEDPSQNFDSHHAEFTFPDGTKAIFDARYLPNCYNEYATYAHGTKRAAQFSGTSSGTATRLFKDQRCEKDNVTWEVTTEPVNAWQAEWNVMIDAIRNDRPHNEARRAAESNLADIMGRAAIHAGKLVTWDDAFKSTFQWCPAVDQMTPDTPPPVRADERGRYPWPSPGLWTEI